MIKWSNSCSHPRFIPVAAVVSSMFTLCRLICLAYVLGSIDFLNLNTPRIDSIDHDENPLKPKPKSSSYVNAKVKQTQSRLRHQHYFQQKKKRKK